MLRLVVQSLFLQGQVASPAGPSISLEVCVVNRSEQRRNALRIQCEPVQSRFVALFSRCVALWLQKEENEMKMKRTAKYKFIFYHRDISNEPRTYFADAFHHREKKFSLKSQR